ncbi:MAG: aspartate kinase [Candidatus Promineofilum sp.]|nr:aspartate kinase [Promineifilum sp.]MCW5862828.1 aspartate kinase [Anaerolineae bacterium]
MALVMKFGGTSVGSADAMRETADLILQARDTWGDVAVIASAMGSKPVKVTDLLLQGAHTAYTGDGDTYRRLARQLRDIHYEAIDGLLSPEGERQVILAEIERFIGRYASLCGAVNVLGELTSRALDAISGMGEQMSVRILAAYLRELGYEAEAIDATALIVTDQNFQNANPLPAETRAQTSARLGPLLERGAIPIVTGFIGATADGVTTTLGRGGSDFSAAILGQAVDADEVWIWTDVDGVMSADPRLVPGAVSIPTLTFREVSELAYYGAKVLHPKTMRPCVESGIPLRIKNTFNPTHPGTVIVDESPATNGALKAVTAIKGVTMINVEGKGMIGVPGIAARTFGAVARLDVSVLLITQASSEQSISFIVPADSAAAVGAELEAEFAAELRRRDIERIWVRDAVAIVTIVGAGIQTTPGIAGRVFSALGDHHVNVIAIAQGSSECGISLVVAAEDVGRAVAHIHELIVAW